jgi:hypothetical protein
MDDNRTTADFAVGHRLRGSRTRGAAAPRPRLAHYDFFLLDEDFPLAEGRRLTEGFRLALKDGTAIDLRSKSGRPFNRYFPEIVAALRQVKAERFAVDGAFVVPVGNVSTAMRRR